MNLVVNFAENEQNIAVDFLEVEENIPVEFEEDEKNFEAGFGEIQQVHTQPLDHRLLAFKDAENQHPIQAIAGLKEALENLKIQPATEHVLGGVIIGDNLKITEAGVLSVHTADAAEEDNTKPITSAAVATQIGNIEILLGTI